MKKLLLLSTVGLAAFGATAQKAISPSVVRVKNEAAMAVSGANKTGTQMLSTEKRKSSSTTPSGMTTAGGKRTYNFVEHLGLLDASIFSNQSLPYMWFKPDANAIYSDGAGGFVADTISYGSYAVTFDPTFNQFNDPAAYPSTDIAVSATDAYTVDSVRIWGFYGRNSTKPGIVDTLRVSFVYGAGAGTNLPIYFFTGMTSSYGMDTVRFAAVLHDSVKNIAAKASSTTPAVIVKDILLTPASLGDTVNGFNRFGVSLSGFNVPANQLTGVTVTFKSGEVYPAWDTVFYGSLNPTEPFKYGMFRPLVFEEKAGKFPTYFDGYYNTGFAKFLPSAPGWSGFYLPEYAFTSEDFNLELPYVDFIISCSTCATIGGTAVKDPSNIKGVNAYPNPATDNLKINFTVTEQSNVTVNVTNTLGQVISSQNLGSFNANQSGSTDISTSGLSAGIYFYTINANGQHITNRFTVAHTSPG